MTVLQDIRALELTGGTAGPVAGMLLADHGAEVVTAEPPSGDPDRARLPGSAVWNRGKRSITADPADPEHRDRIRELLLDADLALVRDSRTLQRRWGIDPAGLRAGNPRLVILEIPPYTPDGRTPWCGGHESNGLLAAAVGAARRQSSHDGGPVEWVLPQFLYVQGLWAAVCGCAALLERERSGLGQRVVVSGTQAVIEAAVNICTVTEGAPDPSTAVGPGGRHPTYTRHRAGDGRWLGLGGLGPKFETIVLRALGLGDMLEEPRMGGGIAGLLMPQNIDWAAERIRAAFRARDRAEWLTRLAELGVPCGPLDPPEDWLDHPQLDAIGMRVTVDDPVRGKVTMPGVPLNLTGAPGRVAGPAPAPGADDASIRPRGRTLPAPPDDRRDKPPRVAPGPLAGYRILDQGTFVAGPYCGSLLAELGADVVKVEPKAGDPFRVNGFTFNRGLRSLALDLTDPAGQQAFRRLAAASDVLVNSQRPGVARKLGIDHDTLTVANPELITVSLSCYGETGPMAGTPGVDMVVQALSGMMARQGGPDGEPVANTMAIIDTATAAMGALATVLALYHRERTGRGQRVWFSLIGTAAFLQAGEIVRYPGRPEPPVGGPDHRGRHPLDRFHRTAEEDGWIRVQAEDPDAVSEEEMAGALARAAGIAGPGEAGEAREVAAVLGALGTGAALRACAETGLPAVAARRVTEALADEELLAAEFVHARAADGGGTLLAPGSFAGFSRTQRRGPMRAPGTGEQSAAILAEAGLEPLEIAELTASGVVRQGEPMPQRLAQIYR
jgi:crotonobetainyl-CoA:carnitine CoA-transferase CaiB-like acyl-CoA transferase